MKMERIQQEQQKDLRDESRRKQKISAARATEGSKG